MRNCVLFVVLRQLEPVDFSNQSHIFFASDCAPDQDHPEALQF